MMNIQVMMLILMLLMPTESAQGHEAGITDTSIQVGYSSIALEYTLPTKELDLESSTYGVRPIQAVRQGWQVSNGDQACEISKFQQTSLANIDSQQFKVLWQCEQAINVVNLNYSLFQWDEGHKNFVRISILGRGQNVILSVKHSTHNIPVAYLLKLWGETAVDEAEAESFFQSKHYFSIGLEHILQGYDHLLFIIGLLLLPLNFRHLVALVSTFTLAHSLTLALSVFNLVRFPAALVEAFIAGSIVYVAVENLWHLRSSKGKTSQLSPWQRRMIMTFLFGLIHGFGFSYLLTEIGLGEQVVGALLYFNLGVEVGQLLVISLIFPLLVYAYRCKRGVVFARLGSILIAGMGSLWLVQRLI